MAYGANPVLYTTKQHFNRILSLADLQDKMVDLEKDREWKEPRDAYSFSEDETWALLQMLSFLQDYAYKGRDDEDAINYMQREWRLTFNSLPFASGDEEQRPGMSCFYVRNGQNYLTVAFSNEDVAYLIVPRTFETDARAIANDLGCEIKIYEDEVINA